MLYPMFAMVVLTFILMAYTLYLRINSVFKKDVNRGYYRLMSGYDVPEYITKTSRHFVNLFETPVLFYAAGILCIVLGIENVFLLSIAWAYIACRAVHALIHITYNNILHRMTVFLLGNLCILSIWGFIIVHEA